MNRVTLLGAAIVAAVFVAGCGESPQVTVYKQGKYQGKADTQPWDNAPLAYGDSKWNKGDRASWEAGINARTLGQNEDIRIYKQ
ncbi:MAG: hypothetical protein OEO84_09845 [Betaproteobacteria bacterium]|nr:hypothetical protein [Betaproteobacteria bacterium]